MPKKNRYYVVWEGKNRGVYEDWWKCKKQIEGYKGAKYKGFETQELADEAYRNDYKLYINTGKKSAKGVKTEASNVALIDRHFDKDTERPELNSLSVDAACSGNPGKMEYRGVYTATGQELFKTGPFGQGTNNIGEFLAIVHGLALLKKRSDIKVKVVYSDSMNGISWVSQKKCKTKLVQTEKNKDLFNLIKRAETWLMDNKYDTKVVKWKTELWGEIPADFGRK